MNRLRHTLHNRKGGTLIEYAFIAAFAAAAISAMSTYLSRSIESTQLSIENIGTNH